MKVFAVIAGVLVTLAVLAWAGYRALRPRAFVAVGRGTLNDVRLIQVTTTRSAPSTMDFNGKAVDAGPEHKYVLIDVRINAPAGKVDFDDFQLVKEKAPKLGEEQNMGDHADLGYF